MIKKLPIGNKMYFKFEKNKHAEHSQRHGEMKQVVNGEKIKHLQFSEFTEGHGSILGTLEDGRKFRLHMSELYKMMDEFEFSVYDRNMGNVLDITLQVNWSATNHLRKNKDFTFKASHQEFRKDGNSPNRVNYIVRHGTDENTKFVEYRHGPYYSGQLIITPPNQAHNYSLGPDDLLERANRFNKMYKK